MSWQFYHDCLTKSIEFISSIIYCKQLLKNQLLNSYMGDKAETLQNVHTVQVKKNSPFYTLVGETG